MEKADWTKSPPELVEVFEAVFPGPPAVARQMFGYPAGFVNGNMFMGLHQHNMVLRLPDGPRAELLAMEGAAARRPGGQGKGQAELRRKSGVIRVKNSSVPGSSYPEARSWYRSTTRRSMFWIMSRSSVWLSYTRMAQLLLFEALARPLRYL
ncbi:MAG: hypothetical protein JWL57_2819 [Actinobacteria bacterium]|nr:hypothetical protein [Actinomycetota bacterium]